MGRQFLLASAVGALNTQNARSPLKRTGRGGLLAFVYALGLGIPFVVAGLGFSRMARTVRFLRRHQFGSASRTPGDRARSGIPTHSR